MRSLIFLYFVSLFYRSEQVVLTWEYKVSLGNLVPPLALFIRGRIKLLNLRQNWGYKNWTYQRKCVTEDGGFPYKGGGSITFCPFSLSWYWRLLDIEWNRKILRSNKSPVTGVKIMAGQQTCPAKFYFFSNQNVSFIEMTGHFSS